MNKTLSILELFSENHYLIPIYQRNYAWDTAEVKQLIRDTADYARNHGEWDYYLGTLIVFRHSDNNLEVIDGQQRLTTLYLILCSLMNWKDLLLDMNWFEKGRLSFVNRENSCRSLDMVYEDRQDSENGTEYEEHIVSIYRMIHPATESVGSELGLGVWEYVQYLLSKVKILRIEVPAGIDKNHYFEVMNSRGVQLEQHEIVKANMMSKLQGSSDDMRVFGRIWDACSNMERYVQMNFYTDERRAIFGEDWTSDPLTDFDGIVSVFPALSERNQDSPMCLRDILDTLEEGRRIRFTDENSGKSDDRLGDDQFYSVINFQNFLLHVLKVYLPEKSIRLDDKQLCDVFLTMLNESSDKVRFVKDFAIYLLRCRFLFDKYVVRRQNGRWCLKRLRSTNASSDGRRRSYYVRTFGKDNEEENIPGEETIMLLSMFHVSTPTMVHKNWLHGVLHFLYTTGNLTMTDYVVFLRRLASAFMLDRYLSPQTEMIEFMDIIYKNGSNAKHTLDDIDWSLLDNGVAVENFIFNYYDYILWKEKEPERFEFSYRNSVEHFYPQHPSNKSDVMDVIPLNMFGNLCLIRNDTNSKFTNNMPEAKLANFKNMDSVFSQSLKLQEMFRVVERNRKDRPLDNPWTVEDIKNAEEEAKALLRKYLAPKD